MLSNMIKLTNLVNNYLALQNWNIAIKGS